MAMLTLAIRGLCAVTFRGGNPPKYEVLLNSSHAHTPTLMALTEFLDPEELKNPWQPDALAFVPVFSNAGVEFKQAAIWLLKGKRVTFTGGTGSLQDWDNRDDAIDFNSLNYGSEVGKVGSAFGIVEIAQGKPSSE